MQLIHFYFLIQTQIQGRAAFLVNTRQNYIPNILTQVLATEISEKAIDFINSVVQLQGERLEYVYSASNSQAQLVLIHVNLTCARISKVKGYNWVGQDYLKDNILRDNGQEKDVILSNINFNTLDNNILI